MITIVADTTSSIPVPLAESLGIPYIPQIIIFGDESFRDDHELDTKTFIQRLRASATLPKTAAPPPALYDPVYEKYAGEGDTVIVLAPSAEVSGTYRSAEVAAGDFPDRDIRVIDTRTVGSGLGSIVLQAHKWAKAGLDAETIISGVMEMSRRHKVFFVVDTLEYLHKGGRIGGAKMLVGSLLQVKPILQMQNGRIEPFESQRTKRKAVARIKDLVAEQCPRNEKAFLTIMHGDALEEATELAEDIKLTLGIDEIKIYDLPPAVLVHSGPGVLAVSFFLDSGSQS
jgi:DegV family protein with EDD domain